VLALLLALVLVLVLALVLALVLVLPPLLDAPRLPARAGAANNSAPAPSPSLPAYCTTNVTT
jgi:hypothetical protein